MVEMRHDNGNVRPSVDRLSAGEGNCWRWFDSGDFGAIESATSLRAVVARVIAKGEKNTVNVQTFETRIAESRKQIDLLPEEMRDALLGLLDETVKRHSQIQGHMDRLRELLGDWRVKIKYLRFDLEATKRELTDLRRQQRDE